MDSHFPQGTPRAVFSSSKPRDSDTDGATKAASPYLQEHLQARRGTAKRPRRSDLGPCGNALDDDLFVAEAQSHATPPSTTTSRRGTPGSGKHGTTHDEDLHKGLGVRELEKHMDKISKLNFDLKMDLFHCRERMAALQEQCSAMAERVERTDELERRAESLAQDKKALLDVNDEMIKELEKRDEAVKEAVNIICDLEEKVELLEQRQSTQTSVLHKGQSPFDASPERYRKPIGASNFLSPPSSAGANNPHTIDSLAASQKRVPSFMSDKKPSTTALRSVYLEPASKLHAVKSYASLLSLREETLEPDALDSPRMSVLSESSFPSIYSPKRSTDAQDEPSPLTQLAMKNKPRRDPSYDRYRNDNSRISEWVIGRVPSDAAPPKQRPQPISPSRQSSLGMQYQSLDNPVVYATLEAPFDENNTPTSLHKINHQSHLVPNTRHSQARSCASSSLGAPLYGQGVFPPTPESLSTRPLSHSRSSLVENHPLVENLGPKPRMASRHDAALQVEDWYRSSQVQSRLADDTYQADGTYQADDIDNLVDDADTSTIHGHNQGIYPDGGSIITGTPSRFQLGSFSSSPAKNDNIFFDGGDAARDLDHGRPRPRANSRRNTGTGVDNVATTPRPSLPRAETSPLMLSPTVAAAADKRRRQSIFHRQKEDEVEEEDDAADVSMNAQPSSNRHGLGKRRLSDRAAATATTVPKSPSPLPSLPPTSTSASSQTPRKGAQATPSGMRASLTQKTQKLFRRMSDSAATRRDPSPPATTHMPTPTSGGAAGWRERSDDRRPVPTLQPRHAVSPKRPRTAYPLDAGTGSQLARGQHGAVLSPGYGNFSSLSSYGSGGSGSGSGSSSDLALVAANRAILSRRQSCQSHQAPSQQPFVPLQQQMSGSGAHRGLFFKRTASTRH